MLNINAKKPYISIIMPCYNSAQYIKESINSVLNQTYENFELIIIDDHSSDNTVNIVKSINNPKLNLITSEKNGGAGKTRNIGIENSSFDYIAFIDADDVWEPDKLLNQINLLIKNPDVDVVCTSYSFIDEQSNKIAGKVIPNQEITLDSYMRNTCIGCSTALINKKNIPNLKFSEIRLRQDTHLWIKLLINNITIRGLDLNLVKYRIRKNQISGNKFNAALKTFKLYWSFKQIPKHKRFINYIYYIINGIAKRLK